MSHSHSPQAHALHWGRHLVSAVAMATLAACGGGGDTPAASTATPSSISGTVATGAAVSGTVYLKDANGALRNTTIAADGSYTLDASGLQAPFLLKAVGTVNGKTVTLLAPVTADNLNGTTNITPLSDLVVANLAGTAATELFDALAGFSSKVNTIALRDAVADLKAKLAPLLAANNLSSVDFLNTPFAANSHTGIDGLLDELIVSVDPVTKLATIKSTVDGSQATDNLATRGAADTAPPIVLSSTYGAKKTDADARAAGIRNLLKQYNDLFATSLPTAAQVAALCDSSARYLDERGDCAAWAADQVSRDDQIGRRAVLARIVAFDVSQPDNIDEAKTASGDITDDTLGVQVHDADGTDGGLTATLLSKVNGAWKIAGEQRKVYINLAGNAYQRLSIDANGTPTTTHSDAGLYIGIDTGLPDVTRAVVTGPGLPDVGVELSGAANQNFQFTQGGGSVWTALGDATLSSASVYTIKVYNSGNTLLATYQQHLGSTSVPRGAQASSKFATVSTNVSAALCAQDTPLIRWTTPAGSVNEHLSVTCSKPDFFTSASTSRPGAGTGTAFEKTVNFGANKMTGATQSQVRIEIRDAGGVVYSTTVDRALAPATTTPVVVVAPSATRSITMATTLTVSTGQAPVPSGSQTVTNDWYSQLCSKGQLQAIDFTAATSVTAETDLNQLKGKTFSNSTCVTDTSANDAIATREQLSFGTTGGVTFSYLPDNLSKVFSQPDVEAVFSTTGSDDPDNNQTSFLRLYKQVVNSISHFFVIERDVDKTTGNSSYWLWK